MSLNSRENSWLSDFKEFVEAESSEVPADVSGKILGYIHKALNPSVWMVFFKLSSIQVVVGFLSLSICDQFGMNPFKTNFSLSEYFMRFGHSACMTFCGFLFLGLGLLSAKIILAKEEFLVIKKNILLQVSALSFLSLCVFAGFGAAVTLSAAMYWLVGALLGGVLLANSLPIALPARTN